MHYDRYRTWLLSGWLKLAVVLSVGGLAAVLVARAANPSPLGDLARWAAWILPLVAVVAVGLMLAQNDPEER